MLVDLDEEQASDANKADVSDQCGEWMPDLGKRWRRQLRTRRLISSSQDGSLDERTEHDADEAESHPHHSAMAATRAPEVELEQGGSGGTGNPKATQGGGHAPSPSPSEEGKKSQEKMKKLINEMSSLKASTTATPRRSQS